MLFSALKRSIWIFWKLLHVCLSDNKQFELIISFGTLKKVFSADNIMSFAHYTRSHIMLVVLCYGSNRGRTRLGSNFTHSRKYHVIQILDFHVVQIHINALCMWVCWSLLLLNIQTIVNWMCDISLFVHCFIHIKLMSLINANSRRRICKIFV